MHRPEFIKMMLALGKDQDCQRCNVDRHICPGCGTNLGHGTEVCIDCSAEIRRSRMRLV